MTKSRALPFFASFMFLSPCLAISSGAGVWPKETPTAVSSSRGVVNTFVFPESAKVASLRNTTCAIATDGVHCWGDNSFGQTEVPGDLKNPRALTVGSTYACAVTDDGVRCWGKRDSVPPRVPSNLKNPQLLTSGSDGDTCAITDEGVRCWDQRYDSLWFEKLIDIRAISENSEVKCALGSNKTDCGTWGAPQTGLERATALGAQNRYACAIVTQKIPEVRCWASNSSDGRDGIDHIYPFQDPRAIAVSGSWGVCVLDGETVKCPDETRYLPPTDLKKVRTLVAGEWHTCAFTDEDTRCWGVPSSWNQNMPQHLALSKRLFSRMPIELSWISRQVYAEKALFFAKLAALTKKYDWTPTESTALFAIEPVLASIPSTAMQELFSRYMQDRNYVLENLTLKNPWDLAREDTSLRMGLQLIQAALESSQVLLSSEANREAADVQLVLGQVLAKNQITIAALTPVTGVLEQSTLLAQEMSAKPQLAGFAQMIGNLKAWMEQR